MELRTLSVLFVLLAPFSKAVSAGTSQTNDYISQSVIFSTITVQHIADRSVKLNWTIFKETGGGLVSIEHSQNGVDWTQVADFSGQGNYQNNYEYTHTLVSPGDNYYRIAYTDVGGTTSYSKICYAKILFPVDLGVFPGLCSSQIDLPCQSDKIKDIRLRGIYGRELSPRLTVNTQGTITAHFDDLPEGIYFLLCGDFIYRFIKLP